jgi:hypothetical protein
MFFMTELQPFEPDDRRADSDAAYYNFDDFAERQCAAFYADTMGRPGLRWL